MAGKQLKPNTMRILERGNVPYEPLFYDLGDVDFDGIAVAKALNTDPEHCYKTLCAVGKSGDHYIFVIPVAEEVDLKLAASACGEKNVALVHVKELPQLTGYERGAVSPLGLKRNFPIYFEETALLFETIEVSGGMKGCSLRVEPNALADLLQAKFAPLIRI